MELDRSLVQQWIIENSKRQKVEMVARGEFMKQKGKMVFSMNEEVTLRMQDVTCMFS
jgi:uncharacterized beta-barrel protein YwiB (DUF1934 family)